MNNAHNAPLKAPTKSVISRDKKTSNNMADRHSTDAQLENQVDLNTFFPQMDASQPDARLGYM